VLHVCTSIGGRAVTGKLAYLETPGLPKWDAVTNHVSHDTSKSSALNFTVYWAFKLKSLLVSGHNEITVNGKVKGKGKAVPLQAWTGPEGSRKLRFPDFMTTAQDGGKVVSLMHRHGKVQVWNMNYEAWCKPHITVHEKNIYKISFQCQH